MFSLQNIFLSAFAYKSWGQFCWAAFKLFTYVYMVTGLKKKD